MVFFFDGLKMSDVARGAQSNYDTMSITDIKQLPVKDLAAPDGAILALWVPSSLLQEGLDVMREWGFNHKQTYIWVKVKKDPLQDLIKNLKNKRIKDSLKETSYKLLPNMIKNFGQSLFSTLAFGMGRLFRQTHEICLIGTSNNKIYKKLANKSQRSVSFSENLKHSAKPEHLQDSLEIMFPGANFLELFARRKRKGWECLGNEVCSGEDIRVSISKL